MRVLLRRLVLLAVCALTFMHSSGCAGAAGAAGVIESAGDARRSGFEDMSPQTRSMQRDDALNPAMLWVAEGTVSWRSPAGNSEKACAGCHGDVATSMRGVAARYPVFDEGLQRPIDLAQRVNQCRERRQQATPWEAESPALLGVVSLVALQSRGMPIAPDADPRLRTYRAKGQAFYKRRIGQLDLSCAQCHDANVGRHLGGSPIPQAHPTGYPLYRLEWQAMGSLQRRFRTCMAGVRAEPYEYGALEWIELELFLAERARGMLVETPAVRP